MSTALNGDYLMLSGLQHWVFCKHQCGLIHLEQVWAENRLTLEGQDLHQNVDQGKAERRGALRIERNVPLISHRLQLAGRADVVEFHLDAATKHWQPFPVEYKRGKPKAGLEDKMQLCAQAMCLEEQFNCPISTGSLFYGKQQRRLEVVLDEALRQETINAAEGFHAMMNAQKLPPTEWGPKCQNCSLREICLPETEPLRTKDYLAKERLDD